MSQTLKRAAVALHPENEIAELTPEDHAAIEEYFSGAVPALSATLQDTSAPRSSMAELYPKYYKDVSRYSELDVYGVHKLFEVDDPSGALQHASKKILLSGVRTGGKSKFKDIREARDTLNRWLEINSHLQYQAAS